MNETKDNTKHNDGDFRNVYTSKYPEYSCVVNYNNLISIIAFIATTEQTEFSDAA